VLVRACSTLVLILSLVTKIAVAGDGMGLPRATPAEVGIDAVGLHKVDDKLQELLETKKLAGGVVLLARNGKVVYLTAVGKADIATGRPIKPDTVFAIASMTKSMAGMSLMILVDEGKVKLDDPLSKYIPSFKNCRLKGGVKPAREIIIRDCLRHTSGLPNKTGEGKTLGAIVESLSQLELLFEPGSAVEYGPGLSVAGRVVEVVSGQPFEEFAAKRIFEPLGMQDTSFRPTAAQRERLAHLYQPTADKKDLEPLSHWLFEFKDVKHRVPNPSGGLFSTAADLVKFYQMALNGGELNGKRIISAETVKQMRTEQTSGITVGLPPGRGWGLGFRLIVQPNANVRKLTAGTFGHGGAFGTEGWVDPTRKTVFILLQQRLKFDDPDSNREALQGLAMDAVQD
jgi:CubicO group peptidase (beta-lactamase class C family)